MRISRYIIVSLALVSLSLPLLAQVNDTYVIPAAGNTPGANGTRWATQFSLFNPQAYPLTVSVTLLPSGGAQGTEKLIAVPANATVFSENILFDAFAASGSGALLVATFPEDNPGVNDTVLARAFLVTSDTYNNSATGTYGQSIPGIWTGLQDFNTDGISGISQGIRNNLLSQGWRTNIGAVNLGRYSATLRVTVYDGAGQTIASQLPFTLPPQGHLQDRLPVNVDRGSIEFFVDDSYKDAVVFAYASVVDPLSGDPRYESPVLLASPSVLFGKKGSVAISTLGSSAATATGAVGKKIDIETARAVRANAIREGSVELMRDASGGYRLMR
jgi:hypothetical protein